MMLSVSGNTMPAPPPNCTVCNMLISEGFSCVCCEDTYYCGQQCLDIDKQLHIEVCRQYTAVNRARPSNYHRIGILSPDTASSPQLIWYRVEEHRLDDGSLLTIPDINSFLHQSGTTPRSTKSSSRNIKNRFNLDFNFKIWFQTDCLTNGAARNMCVFTLTDGVSTLRDYWRGPLVATRSNKVWESELGEYEDVEPKDVRHFVDYFALGGVE